MEFNSGANRVQFKSQDLQLTGDLYTPEGFNNSESYPTIVFAGPFKVKEQIDTVYGKKLSAKGFVFLAFDHRGYGDSEGDVRNNEKFDWKQEGIRDAISYVRTLPFVDREKVYGPGGCAGGGYMVLVAVTDKRLKAIASVSGVMNPQSMLFMLCKVSSSLPASTMMISKSSGLAATENVCSSVLLRFSTSLSVGITIEIKLKRTHRFPRCVCLKSSLNFKPYPKVRSILA